MKEEVGILPSQISKRCGRFRVRKVELTITGTVAQKKRGVFFTARASGMRLELQNTKATEKDWLSVIATQISKGKALVRISGRFLELQKRGEKKPRLILYVGSATFLEPKD